MRQIGEKDQTGCLESLDIVKADRENKILLPTKKGKELYPETTKAIHDGRHSEESLKRVTDKLDLLYDRMKEDNLSSEELKEKVLNVIKEERAGLENGSNSLYEIKK